MSFFKRLGIFGIASIVGGIALTTSVGAIAQIVTAHEEIGYAVYIAGGIFFATPLLGFIFVMPFMIAAFISVFFAGKDRLAMGWILFGCAAVTIAAVYLNGFVSSEALNMAKDGAGVKGILVRLPLKGFSAAFITLPIGLFLSICGTTSKRRLVIPLILIVTVSVVVCGRSLFQNKVYWAVAFRDTAEDRNEWLKLLVSEKKATCEGVQSPSWSIFINAKPENIVAGNEFQIQNGIDGHHAFMLAVNREDHDVAVSGKVLFTERDKSGRLKGSFSLVQKKNGNEEKGVFYANWCGEWPIKNVSPQ